MPEQAQTTAQNLSTQMTEDQMVNVLNAVRNSADDTRYANIVPPATRDNLSLVGNPIVSGEYSYAPNTFLDTLLNKIVYTIAWNRMYRNKYRIFKSFSNPLGGDIEELHTNPIEETDEIDCNNSDLLSGTCTPDVEAEYHRMNRKKRLCTQINRVQLRQAFTSFQALNAFINSQITNLFSSNEIWEERYTKELFAEAYAEGKMVTQQTVFPEGDANAATFLKQVQTVARLFTYARTDFNAWNKVTGRPARTSFSLEGGIYLVIRDDAYVSLGIDLLARLFNLSVVEANAFIITVDEFPGQPNLVAVLCDQAYPLITDNDREMTSWFDPATRCWKYYFFVEQTYSVSLFANAVGFYTGDAPEPPSNRVGSARVGVARAGA